MSLRGPKGGPLYATAGLLIFLALAGCAQGQTASNAVAPGLAIASYFPVTIDGHHFRPGEKVVLRAQPHQAGLKPVYARVRVKPDGAFSVQVRGYGLDPCTGFTVTATGSKGSRVIVNSSPHGCPPVPAPSA